MWFNLILIQSVLFSWYTYISYFLVSLFLRTAFSYVPSSGVKFLKFREAIRAHGAIINITARFFLSRKTPPTFSARSLSLSLLLARLRKQRTRDAFSDPRVCLYTRCLVYHKLSPHLQQQRVFTRQYCRDKVEIHGLRGRELVAPLIPRF